MKTEIRGTHFTALLLLVLSLGVSALAGMNFMSMWKDDLFLPAPGFEKHMLSEWHGGLKNTPADVPVYIQQGEEPGGTVFLMGGTHPTEPASATTATLFLERAKVTRGRLIVITQVNAMGFTHNSPPEAIPSTLPSQRPTGAPHLPLRLAPDEPNLRMALAGHLHSPRLRAAASGKGAGQPQPVLPGRSERLPDGAARLRPDGDDPQREGGPRL
ncbi:hypothetical protein MASR2M79_08830 [Aminivibrio sp.]